MPEAGADPKDSPPALDWGLGRYEEIAAQLMPAAQETIARAAPASGEAVVDVGCGTGNAALLAAERGARVTGVDPAPRLLEVAAAEAAARGLEAEFVQGDAAAIPLADGAADLVVSVFGAIFAPDPAAAAAEMARVSAPRGRIALSAWVPGGAVGDVARTAREATAAARGEGPGSPPFPWHEQNALEELLGPYGFEIEREELPLPFTAASPREFAETEMSSHPLWGAGGDLLAAAGTLDDVRARVLEILEEGNEDPEGFRVTSRYVIALARRPA